MGKGNRERKIEEREGDVVHMKTWNTLKQAETT